MSSCTEILDTLDGKRSDVPPAAIFTQSATVSQMNRLGVSWPEAHSDPDRMSKLAMGPHDLYGYCSARVPFDITAEAERLGCRVDLGASDRFPTVTGSPYRSPGGIFGDPEGLPSKEDFAGGGRCTVVERAVETLVKGNGDDVAVVAGVNGALTVLTLVIGSEDLVMGTMMEPDRILRWLTAVNPLIREYVRRLSDSGADSIVVVEGCASPDFIDPQDFDRFSGRYLRDVMGTGRVPKVLHMCGEVAPILTKMAATGAEGLSIESAVPPSEAAEIVDGKAVLVGNVGPLRSLMEDKPDSVKADALECARAGFGIIAPGCGVPLNVTDRCMSALLHYHERNGRARSIRHP